MNDTAPTVKPSGAMLALAAITLVLSAYGLYGLMVDFAAAPWFLALLAIAGLDLTALAAGKHAIDLARDGDSPAVWNLVVIGVALVSAAAQWAHQTLAGAPWIVGLVFAMFPLATVLLFEGTLRRAARLSGRVTGRVAPTRATFELLQWIVYPKATWQAFRISIADRSLGADGAFKVGLLVTAPRPERPAEQRRGVTIDYAQALGLGSALAITGGQPADSPDMTGGQPAGAGGAPVSLASLVRAAMTDDAGNVRELADVTADVRRSRPDASAETVRRAYQREVTNRSA